MLNSGIIDLAIGMAFIFGATAGLSSVITELVARFLGLRGAYLLLGLRELLDSKSTSVVLGQAEDDFRNARAVVTATGPEASPSSATGALLGSPILRSQGMTGNIVTRKLTMDSATASPAPAAGATPAAGAIPAASAPPATPPATPQDGNSRAPLPKSGNPWRTWSLRRSLPSYISARSFTEAVIDLVIPNAAGQTNMGEIQLGIDRLPASMGPLRSSLQALAANAGGDVTRFRNSIEHWYDDHMARVSGWYKRHAAWITLAVGAALVILLNINAVTIGRALYSDSAVRSAVSTAASQGNPCPAPSGQSQAQQAQGQQNCLAGLEKRVSDAAQTGLPLGWGIVPACAVPNAKCGWWEQHGITSPGDGSPWQVILVLIGFLATIAALTPGAQFWFGLVVKLNSLRSSGPPPASSAS